MRLPKQKLKQLQELDNETGVDDEKVGKTATQELMKEQEVIEKQEESQELQILNDARKSKSGYNRLIAFLLLKRLKYVDWNDWSFQVAPTDKGVVMELVSPGKRYFRCGFETTGEAKYDLNAVNLYGQRAQDTIDTYGRPQS
jgi:hypothetical protein